MNLIHVWVFLVGLVVILYVLPDGFILGIDLLFFSAENETEQDVLIGTIAPVWDANQIWNQAFFRGSFMAACGAALFIATVFIWTPYHNPELSTLG